MSITLLALISGAAGMAVLWQLFGRHLVRSPLDNLPGPPATSWFQGNVPELSTTRGGKWWSLFAELYGPVSRLTSLFGERTLHVYDPKALHSILIKDIELYPKSLVPISDGKLLLGPGILAVDGPQHRRQRKMLNPVFSIVHLRNMTDIFYDVAHKMLDAIKDRVGTQEAELDMNGWAARTTLEMLGQASLAYSFDDFKEETADPWAESLKTLFPVLSSIPLFGLIVPHMSRVFSEGAIRRVLRLFPSVTLHNLLDISDILSSRSREIIQEKLDAYRARDADMVQCVEEGKDLMSILLKANTSASESDMLTDEELIAQVSSFILAGMDTTSNSITRTLHLLAKNPKMQAKLRAEVFEAQGGPANSDSSDLPFDDLLKLPFLDAVGRETLRLFPPVPLISRRAKQDVVLPLSAPIRGRDGTSMPDVFVPKGTVLNLNIEASNRNKALWGEDADVWRPERWLEDLPGELTEARVPGVYANLMTFAGGVHACIGFKVAQLELKLVLALLLTHFEFALTDKPISWNSSGVTYPTTGDGSNPKMLLTVKALPL